MPKAKKLPSGSWRCQVYLGDEYIDGKRKKRIESVTVDDPTEDGRIECERLARQLEKRSRGKELMTVGEALARYVKSREKRLSASTLTSYRSYLSSAYSELQSVPVHLLTSDIVQNWMDDYADTHSPKTCRNAFGLLQAAVHAVMPELILSVRLPERKDVDYYTPTDEDIKILLESIKGTDLERAVLLSAFGTLRRGEVCALLRSDIKGNTVTINKALSWTGRDFVLKAPKTRAGIRTVNLPPEAIKIITADRSGSERIYPKTPNALTHAFIDALTAAGLPHFRFHDLRAYSASIRHAIGIPDQYIMLDGGWKTDSVLKKVYRRALDDKRKVFSDKICENFSHLMKE